MTFDESRTTRTSERTARTDTHVRLTESDGGICQIKGAFRCWNGKAIQRVKRKGGGGKGKKRERGEGK